MSNHTSIEERKAAYLEKFKTFSEEKKDRHLRILQFALMDVLRQQQQQQPDKGE